MDFGNLAQLTNPSQSFFPQGVVDPLGYRLWMDKAKAYTNAIPGMQQEAAMNLAHQQQAEKEYMAGAPGRETLAEVANMDAASAKDQQPLKAEGNKWKLTNLRDDEKAKAESLLRPVNEYADAWDTIRDKPDKHQAFFNMLKDQHIQLPNGYVMGTDHAKDVAILDASRAVRENAPQYAVKRDVANISSAARLAIAATHETNANARANLAAQVRVQTAQEALQARQAMANGRPLTASQSQALLIQQAFPNDPEAQLQAWQLLATGGQGMAQQTKQEIMQRLMPGMQMPDASVPGMPTPTNSNIQYPGVGAPAPAGRPVVSPAPQIGGTSRAPVVVNGGTAPPVQVPPNAPAASPQVGNVYQVMDNGKPYTGTIKRTGKDKTTGDPIVLLDNGKTYNLRTGQEVK